MFEAIKLYGYWRSSASYRVRIALNLKRVAWVGASVNLPEGEQGSEAYRKLNPIGLVPALVRTDGTVITQSLAIVDWLDHVEPEPPLFPEDPIERAQVMAAGHVIAVDTHPLQNSGVVGHLKTEYALTQRQAVEWMAHWMHRGFSAFEALCRQDTPFAFGEAPGFADICLIPQLYNARRWKVDTSAYPRLREIDRNCLRLSAFREAHPDVQPDAEKS